MFNETECTQDGDLYQQPGCGGESHPEAVFLPASVQSGLAGILEQNQIKYLSGRKAAKTIKDKTGNDIILEGEVISRDIINLAREKGCLIDLIMNNKA